MDREPAVAGRFYTDEPRRARAARWTASSQAGGERVAREGDRRAARRLRLLGRDRRGGVRARGRPAAGHRARPEPHRPRRARSRSGRGGAWRTARSATCPIDAGAHRGPRRRARSSSADRRGAPARALARGAGAVPRARAAGRRHRGALPRAARASSTARRSGRTVARAAARRGRARRRVVGHEPLRLRRGGAREGPPRASSGSSRSIRRGSTRSSTASGSRCAGSSPPP